MAKKKMTKPQALKELYTLQTGLFRYLHRDYNEALEMAIEALEKEMQQERGTDEQG